MTANDDTELKKKLGELLEAQFALGELVEMTPEVSCSDCGGFSNTRLLRMVSDRLQKAIIGYMAASQQALDKLPEAENRGSGVSSKAS